jgi:pyruvate carboxylase
MPGSVSTIAVKLGQEVKAGDVIATLEAMKMETVLHAPRDGKIAEILVTLGQHIDTKDLLMVLD